MLDQPKLIPLFQFQTFYISEIDVGGRLLLWLKTLSKNIKNKPTIVE